MPTMFVPAGLPAGAGMNGAPLILSMPLLTQGNILFVNDSDPQARNARSHGSIDRPFLTAAYALTQARANKGDSIVIGYGHSESLATVKALTSVAGVGFVHMGSGLAWRIGASGSGGGSAGPQQVSRAASLVTSAFDIFTVVGAVRLTDIHGLVEVAVANTAALVKLVHTPAGGVMTATDLCANSASIALAAIGTVYSITGTLANAGLLTVNQVRIAQATAIVLHTGALSVAATGQPATGTLSWHATYQPLSPGSYMTAA